MGATRKSLQSGTIAASTAAELDIVAVDEVRERPDVDLPRAQKVAAEFPFIAGRDPAELGLARVTNWIGGRCVRVAGGAPRAFKLKPRFEDKLAWVLVYDQVQLPTLGGPVPTTEDPGPFVRPDISTFMIWVDAATGELLRDGRLHRR